MRKALIDLIDKSGMVENRKRCEIIADELIAAGVCFAPVELVIRKDITDDMLRQMQNALAMPAMIMPYNPEQETVEIVPQWITVTEKLPEFFQNVLMYFREGKTFAAGFLSEEKGRDPLWCSFTDAEWFTELDNRPDYWMPLPEPPKEVQK